MKDGNYTVPCPLWPTQPRRCEIILKLKITFSILSFFGCSFVITLIWLFRTYKSYAQRLTLFLCISAGFQSLSYAIGDLYSNDNACIFQALVMQYFDWTTILWVCAISVNNILIIHGASSSMYEKWFHLVCWLFPFLWAGLPFIGNNYGRAGAWCWIKRDATALRFGTWYIPIFLLIILLVIAYIYIIITVIRRSGSWSGFYNEDEERANNLSAKEVKPLAAFPLIYVALNIPMLICRIEDAIHPDELPSYPLLILAVIFAPSVGGVNAVAYAFYNKIHKMLTLRQVKFAFLAHFSSSAQVTHNVDVGDDLSVVAEREMGARSENTT